MFYGTHGHETKSYSFQSIRFLVRVYVCVEPGMTARVEKHT